jgi:hypothetical protein
MKTTGREARTYRVIVAQTIALVLVRLVQKETGPTGPEYPQRWRRPTPERPARLWRRLCAAPCPRASAELVMGE